MQSRQIVEYVDSAASVKVGWLEQPEVVAIEVTERAAVLGKLPLLEVELFELGALLVMLLFAGDCLVQS